MSPATLFLEGLGLIVAGLVIRWLSTRRGGIRPRRAASRRAVASVLVAHYGLDGENPARPEWPSPVVMAGVALSSVAVLAMTTGSSIRSPGSRPFEGPALEELRDEIAALAGGLRNRIAIASHRLDRVLVVTAPGRIDARVVRSTAATARVATPPSARVTDGPGQSTTRGPEDPPTAERSRTEIVSIHAPAPRPREVPDRIESPPRPRPRSPLADRVPRGSAMEGPGPGTPDGPPLARFERNAASSERTDGSGRVARSEPAGRLERAGAVDKSERVDRLQKVENVAKPDKAEKLDRSERPAQAERVEKIDKLEKPARPEKVEKIERSEKPAKPERVEKVARAEKPERVEKPTRPGK